MVVEFIHSLILFGLFKKTRVTNLTINGQDKNGMNITDYKSRVKRYYAYCKFICVTHYCSTQQQRGIEVLTLASIDINSTTAPRGRYHSDFDRESYRQMSTSPEERRR